MRNLFILLACLGGVLHAAAQNSTLGSVKGRLADSVNKESMGEATISLFNAADSTVAGYVLASASGEFSIKNLRSGAYRLQVSFAGYTTVRKTLTLSAAAPMADLGTIYMYKSGALLDEVMVEAPPITVNKDTVEFRAGAFKTVPNSTAEDLLKKLPGVEVDKDGNVKAQGEDIKKIYVDGKEFFGTDPKMATKNITADMIESVQVYDDMSDQAKFTRIDDGSRSKTINIKLKKDRRKGYFGRATAGVGSDNRYTASLNANKFDNDRRFSLVSNSNNLNRQSFSFNDVVGNMGGYGGRGGTGGGNTGGGNPAGGITRASSAGLNFTDKIGKKIDLAASYFYSSSDDKTYQTSLRQTFFPRDSITFQDAQNQSASNNQNHRFNLKMEYYIDSMNSILYTPSLVFQQSARSAYDSSSTRTTQPGIDYLALSGINRNTNHRQGINLNNNILFRHKFRKAGRTFTLGLTNTINNSDGEGTSSYPLTFYSPNGNVERVRDQNFESNQQTRSANNVISTSYTEPLGSNKVLELNYAYTHNEGTSNREAFNYNKLTRQFDSLNPQQTNYFENSFLAHRMGLNFRVQHTKYGFQAGGSMQSSALDNTSVRAIFRVNGKDSVIHYRQNAINLFPTANFNYNFRRGKTFRVNYRGRTNQPAVTQLQDVRNEANSLRTVLGNPNLKQEFSHDVNASYNAYSPVTFKYVNVNVNYSRVSNKIVNSIDLDSARGKGVQLIRPVNLDGAYNLSSSLTVGIPLRNKMKGSSLNFSNSMNYNRDISLLYQLKNTTTSMTIRQKAGINIDIKDKLNFGIDASLSYNTINYSGAQNSSQQLKLSQNQDNTYFSQTYSANINYFFTPTLILSTNFDYLLNSGRAAGYNQSVPLWNAGLAKQLFRKRNGEVKFSVNDLLNQNRNINRSIGENYIIDSRTVVLQRYFLLTVTYNLNRSGGRNRQGTQQMQRGMEGGGQRRMGNENRRTM